MTNYEKYKDELLKHVIAQSYIGLDIHTNKLVDCSNLCCEKCRFNANEASICKNAGEMEKWLNSEYIEEEKEEVDWLKVPIDTKVLVSEDNENWYKRYFAGYNEYTRTVCAFKLGATSWTNDYTDKITWRYAKLAEE